jgi:hypothetical protein
MVMNCADWPEEAATAATPPSRAATRFSKTSTVGYRWGGRGLSGGGRRGCERKGCERKGCERKDIWRERTE